MRSLKDIRTATNKRATEKRVDQAKFIRVKSGNKIGRRLVSPKVLKKLKIKEATNKKKRVSQLDAELESRKKAYQVGDRILDDAFIKARDLASQALREKEQARQIKVNVSDQLRQAKGLGRDLKKKINSNELTEKSLDSRQESIKVMESNISKTRDDLQNVRAQSVNIERELAALLMASITRLETMETYEKEIIKDVAVLAKSLGEILKAMKAHEAKNDDKEEHQDKKEEELNTKEVILDDRRTALHNAEQEIRSNKD